MNKIERDEVWWLAKADREGDLPVTAGVPDVPTGVGTTYWNGAKAVCDWCKSELVDSKGDVDHDDGVCEVFYCLTCGHKWHDELPD